MDWHTVTQVAENIYRISEPFGELDARFGIKTVNMYLVLGAERAALIDTGTGIGDLRNEVCKLTSLPCTVLSTHFHWDHVGANSHFDEVSIHMLEADLVEQEPDMGWLLETLGLPEARAVLPPGFDPAAYRIQPKAAARVLQDGDVIDLGGRTLRVLHIPGHSPGHTAFWDEESGALFTGDSAYPGPMYACFAGGNPTAFAHSLRRMAELPDVKLICPGHNEIVSEKGWLGLLADGAHAALAGEVAGEPGDGFIEGKEYKFDAFSIWLP